MNKQRVEDEGRAHKYFHILPNMVDDDLDPFQYRLYGHYKRICGDTGTCEESVRQTADATKMSTKTVEKARDELADMGYIHQVKPSKQEARKGQTVHVTLVDRWAENVYRYAKAVVNLPQQDDEPVVKIPQPVVNMTQQPAEAVVNLPRLKEHKEPNKNTHTKPRPPKPDIETHKDAIIELMKVDGYDPAMVKPENLSRSERGKYADIASELAEINIHAHDIPALYKLVCAIADSERWSAKVKSTTLSKHSGKYLQSKIRKLPPPSSAPPPSEQEDMMGQAAVLAEVVKLNRGRAG